MPLHFNRSQLESLRQHAAREYPGECCGILLGKGKAAHKQVMEVVPLANLRPDPVRARQSLVLDELEWGSEKNRYCLDPFDQLRVEKGARERGLDVIGYYHSHPDHPAQPSIYDREHRCRGILML